MNQKQQLFIPALLSLFFILTCTLTIKAQNTKTAFRFTVFKSTGEPQKKVLVKINGRNEQYTPNEQGVIQFDFEISPTYLRTVSFFFTSNKEKAVTTFDLTKENATKTLYLDSPEDVVLFKQQNQTFTIEGLVQDTQKNPIPNALISIQGTGRKTFSDEIGLFSIEADYNHPIAIRAEGMENQLLHINSFLRMPNEPFPIVLAAKGKGKVYSVVAQMPEYPQQGMKGFSNYLKRNLKYPEKAKKDSIEGVVGIQFIVETNGEITSPVIVRHLEPTLDTVALNLIKQMPHWIPASENGVKVRCRYTVPVQFKIPRPKPQPKVEIKQDTIKPDIQPTDSLIIPKDTLSADSLNISSLNSKDSLIVSVPDSLKPAIPPTDSLQIAPTDTLGKDTTKVTTDSLQSQQPKKRNIFVRFFRWLFGIKDKETTISEDIQVQKELPKQTP